MNTSNSVFLFLAFFLLGTSVLAQETNATPRTEEIGLRLTNLQDFGLIHKKELENGTFRRLRLAGANVGLTLVQGSGTAIFNAGIFAAIGWEKRIPVADIK